MTKEEFAALAMAIRTYYPRENLMPNDEALNLWYEALRDLDAAAAGKALKTWVKHSRWAPTIADIIDGSRFASYEIAYEHKRVEALAAANQQRIEQSKMIVTAAVGSYLKEMQDKLQKMADAFPDKEADKE